MVLLCVRSIVFRGFNFGIDFAGGNSLRVPASQRAVADVRQAAEDAGAQVSTAQVVGGDTVLLRTGPLDTAGEHAVVAAVAKAAGVEPPGQPRGGSADWGRDVTDRR